jgi:pilus assembly protein CpaB
MNDISDFVARSEFLPGDPIRRDKLAEGDGSFLSATLGKGMRGVSVVVSAESASGGFISPNDHVDVVLTRTSPTAGVAGSVPRSETILRNVLVLAINSKAGDPDASGTPSRGNTFAGQAIATLALGPTDADLVVSASAMGKLSLLLRSAVDSADAGKGAEAQDSANQAIRMTSPFWLQ